jgi:signal transduction histidine kinase
LALNLDGVGRDPSRLVFVQQAYEAAESTPWSLRLTEPAALTGLDLGTKALVAEVQSRCGGPFVAQDTAPREARLTRENARLRRTLRQMAERDATRDRLLAALATSGPTDRPSSWAERAGLAWCGVPGVASARVAWSGAGADDAPPEEPDPPPAQVFPLAEGGRTMATVCLRGEADHPVEVSVVEEILPAWRAWAALVDSRARLADSLSRVMSELRARAESEGPRLRKAKFEALAEFAAGAGHELNNPLAVIVGRAQLLLARETDPRSLRSLRAILAQAQRAHRILRDLMFVARPPDLRPRACQPDEIWRSSFRDARPEADERGVRLLADALGFGRGAWADPDSLRHLADTLVRNALEATPPGGTVRVASEGDAGELRWSVRDSGRGITPTEGDHLFDPFFCGRQAGRGLGMGLPRAARFVALAGGEVRWQSVPGQGSTFSVLLPLSVPPPPTVPESARSAATHSTSRTC